MDTWSIFATSRYSLMSDMPHTLHVGSLLVPSGSPLTVAEAPPPGASHIVSATGEGVTSRSSVPGSVVHSSTSRL